MTGCQGRSPGGAQEPAGVSPPHLCRQCGWVILLGFGEVQQHPWPPPLDASSIPATPSNDSQKVPRHSTCRGSPHLRTDAEMESCPEGTAALTGLSAPQWGGCGPAPPPQLCESWARGRTCQPSGPLTSSLHWPCSCLPEGGAEVTLQLQVTQQRPCPRVPRQYCGGR